MCVFLKKSHTGHCILLTAYWPADSVSYRRQKRHGTYFYVQNNKHFFVKDSKLNASDERKCISKPSSHVGHTVTLRFDWTRVQNNNFSPVCGVRHRSSVLSTSRMLKLGSPPHILKGSENRKGCLTLFLKPNDQLHLSALHHYTQ